MSAGTSRTSLGTSCSLRYGGQMEKSQHEDGLAPIEKPRIGTLTDTSKGELKKIFDDLSHALPPGKKNGEYVLAVGSFEFIHTQNALSLSALLPAIARVKGEDDETDDEEESIERDATRLFPPHA